MTPKHREDAYQAIAAETRRLGLPFNDVRRIDALFDDKRDTNMPRPNRPGLHSRGRQMDKS
jgi:hypothetical protein